MGKIGEEEDDEEKPATERRRKYTDLGLDLGEREKQVVCHESVLDFLMKDKARRKQRCEPDDHHHFCELQRKLTSFVYLFLHFSEQPGFSMAFDAAEGNKRLPHSLREIRRAAAEGRERDEYSSAEEQ